MCDERTEEVDIEDRMFDAVLASRSNRSGGWWSSPATHVPCGPPSESRRSDSRRTLNDCTVNPHARPSRPSLGPSSAMSRPTSRGEGHILDVIASASPSCNRHRSKVPDSNGYPLRAKAMRSPAHRRTPLLTAAGHAPARHDRPLLSDPCLRGRADERHGRLNASVVHVGVSGSGRR